MIITTFVGPPNGHHHEIFLPIEAEIIDGGLKQMLVSFQPFHKVEGRGERHLEIADL